VTVQCEVQEVPEARVESATCIGIERHSNLGQRAQATQQDEVILTQAG
jgi:hypothetical protein